MFLNLLFSIFTLSILAGCAAGLQTPNPALVGNLKGKPQYSISGYTPWGVMSKTEAKAQSLGYMKEMCAEEPEFIDIQTFDASRMGHHQLGWTAIFFCRTLKGA